MRVANGGFAMEMLEEGWRRPWGRGEQEGGLPETWDVPKECDEGEGTEEEG